MYCSYKRIDTQYFSYDRRKQNKDVSVYFYPKDFLIHETVYRKKRGNGVSSPTLGKWHL